MTLPRLCRFILANPLLLAVVDHLTRRLKILG
jgi:hypothetical protein